MRTYSYKGHFVRICPYLRKPDFWTAEMLVFCPTAKGEKEQQLSVPEGRLFTTKDEAEEYASFLAGKWIDGYTK